MYNVSKVAKAKLIGVDLSEIALSQLRMMVPEVKILRKDVIATSLHNESCDFAVSTMTIEHVDDNKFLKEVFRILRPNGYFLVN